jgi:hypothetical protein
MYTFKKQLEMGYVLINTHKSGAGAKTEINLERAIEYFLIDLFYFSTLLSEID